MKMESNSFGSGLLSQAGRERLHVSTSFEKICRQWLAGIINTEECTAKLFDAFAEVHDVFPEIIPNLDDALPATFRTEFSAAISDALSPGFQWVPFVGHPMTDSELEADGYLRTKRIRAWAFEIKSFWTDGDSQNQERARFDVGAASIMVAVDRDRQFFDGLGPESGPELCRREGCLHLRVALSIFCQRHHFEMIVNKPCPF